MAIQEVKSQSDAYKLAAEFCKWLDEERSISCVESDITVTGDTVENFADACREIKEVGEVEAIPAEYAKLQGGRVVEMMGTQRIKGEQRCDLYILDTGKYRLVYVS
jgi:hypothetical protein